MLKICLFNFIVINTEINTTSLFCRPLHLAVWRAHWWCCPFKACPSFCSCSFLNFSRLSSAGASDIFHPLPHRLWLRTSLSLLREHLPSVLLQSSTPKQVTSAHTLKDSPFILTSVLVLFCLPERSYSWGHAVNAIALSTSDIQISFFQ